MPRGAFVFDADLPEAHPGAHPAQNAVAFAHLVKDGERLAVDKAEVPGVERHFYVSDFVNQLVEERSCGQFEPAFALAFGANRVDHLVAFTPLRDQIEDDFGRVLQVGVDDHDRLPAAIVHPGGHSDLMPEVAGKNHRTDAVILLGEFSDAVGGAVAAAVIHEDELPLFTRLVHHIADAGIKQGQIFELVVYRNDHAKNRVRHGVPLSDESVWVQ